LLLLTVELVILLISVTIIAVQCYFTITIVCTAATAKDRLININYGVSVNYWSIVTAEVVASAASYTAAVQLVLPIVHHHTTTVATEVVVIVAVAVVAPSARCTIDMQMAASSASRDNLGAVNEQ
jgi:hypothetical protein